MKFLPETNRNARMTAQMAIDRVDLHTRDHLATLDAVAQTLGVSKRFVQKLVQRKAIPVIRLSGRCTRFDLNRVLAAVKRFEIQEMTLR